MIAWPSQPVDLALWLVWGHTYFASGSSAPADLLGLARWLHPIGVSIPDLSAPALRVLLDLAHLPLPIFVDSGAFSEVEVVDGRVRVVAPITDADWEERVAVSLRIAQAFGPWAYCVAPDRVGDQGETLRRMRLFGPIVRAWRDAGARVVVPLQRGALTTLAFRGAAAKALELTVDELVSALPSNKDAMPLGEIETFLRTARPRALHLLGLGPKSPRFPAIHDLLRRLAPSCAVSYDSNLIAAHVGRANGSGGARRAATALQDMHTEFGSERAREDAVATLVGPSMALARAALAGLIPIPTRPVQRGLFDSIGATP